MIMSAGIVIFFSLLEQLCFTYNMSLMHILSKSVYTYVKL